jgi:thymidylate synthase
MKDINIGLAWFDAMRTVLDNGLPKDDELIELLNYQGNWKPTPELDPLIEAFANIKYIEEMEKVFFSRHENMFNHSYYDRVVGPYGNSGTKDIVKLLRDKTSTKKALLTFVPEGNGKVPCINIIHFLILQNRLHVHYFARGQDIFNKFYADAYCIQKYGELVAKELSIPIEACVGTISSAHIYLEDVERVRSILTKI